jgi:hypothetical protein
MHRRSFVSMLFAAPVLATLPVQPHLHAERRYRPVSLLSAGFSWIQVEVYLAWTERGARAIRNREAQDPFDGLVGEFYVSDSHAVDVPADISGTVATFETIVGVAAEEGVIHVGGVMRGNYVWIIRMNGGPVDHVIDLAEGIMTLDLPRESDVLSEPALLHRLLPEPDVFPVEVEVRER